MSKVIQRGSVTPSMNLTPLIDVVFLLIIFFMLVNNIVSEENVDMVLPQLEDPQVRDVGDIDRLVINVAPAPFTRDGRRDAPLQHVGRIDHLKIGTGSDSRFDPADLPAITDKLRAAKAQNPDLEVLLRSDGAIYYQAVQPIMDAIRNAGIETIHLVAEMPSD